MKGLGLKVNGFSFCGLQPSSKGGRTIAFTINTRFSSMFSGCFCRLPECLRWGQYPALDSRLRNIDGERANPDFLKAKALMKSTRSRA